MNSNGLRWAYLCVSAATSLVWIASTTSANAARTHLLKPGESLASVARKYGVTVKDIAAANHLTNVDSVRDGSKLTIPDPPKPVAVASSLHRPAILKGDRISVRIGPGVNHRRLTMFDSGVAVTVTALQDGWAQVALPDGRTGWVREDFVSSGRKGAKEGAKQVASNDHKAPAKKPSPHHAAVVASDEDRRRSRRRVSHSTRTSTHIARKHPEHQRPHREARRHERSHHEKHVARAEHHRRHIAKAERVDRHAHRHLARREVPEADRPEADTDIVRTAYAYRGTPYRYGGSSRGGFDCSGFTSYVYRKKGVSLPHSAQAQAQVGKKIGRGELKPGDLVFFHTVTPGISHVGMYVGNGRFVHASSRRSGGVRVDSLSSGYYSQRFRGARRVKP